jgi:hypothetical protein
LATADQIALIGVERIGDRYDPAGVGRPPRERQCFRDGLAVIEDGVAIGVLIVVGVGDAPNPMTAVTISAWGGLLLRR